MITVTNSLLQVCFDTFNRHGENGLLMINNSVVLKQAVLDKFRSVGPIPEDQLEDLRLFVAEKCPERDERYREDLMKITYTIGTLI